EGFRQCRTPPNSPYPSPRPAWSGQQDGIAQLDDLAYVVSVDDFERGDSFRTVLDRDRTRLVDQVIEALERHLDEVILGVVGNADERQPLGLDLVAEVK